jgi:hypothetical protein
VVICTAMVMIVNAVYTGHFVGLVVSISYDFVFSKVSSHPAIRILMGAFPVVRYGPFERYIVRFH